MGDSDVGPYAVARFAGSTALVGIAILGLAPQALCCRPLRGLIHNCPGLLKMLKSSNG